MAIQTVVTGVGGRMGQAVLRALAEDPVLKLHAGLERKGHALAGTELTPGVRVFDAADAALAGAQVAIDFTAPASSLALAAACAKAKVAAVIGSTGLSADEKSQLEAYAKQVAIVCSPNMSVGVNLVIELAAQLARRLGDGFDVEILEAHHRDKKDAPSGTALRLAEELTKALGRQPSDVRSSRVGAVGARPPREVGIQSLRGGDVVGEHTVFFFGDGERVELTHRATSRDQFARGALRAAKWVVQQPPGLYSMADVLR